MGAHIEYMELTRTAESKPFRFDLLKDAHNSFSNEIDSIAKHNELLVGHTIKNKDRQLLSKYKHGNNIHKHGKQQNE